MLETNFPTPIGQYSNLNFVKSETTFELLNLEFGHMINAKPSQLLSFLFYEIASRKRSIIYIILLMLFDSAKAQ